MPFFLANFSHFVAAFAGGRGFSRGRGKVAGGRVRRTPEAGVEVMGQVVRSWLMRDWAQSRAVAARRAEGGWGGRGVESWQRRLPRSKVGGMGLRTVMALELGGLVG